MKIIKKQFTMLELIVSMSVLTVMMIIMMEFFSSAQKAWIASSEQADIYDNARIALDLMTSNLNAICYNDASNVNFYHPSTTPDQLGFFSYMNGGLKKIMYKVDLTGDPETNKNFGFLTRAADDKGDYTTKPKGSEPSVFGSIDNKKFKRIVPYVCGLEFICLDKGLKKITAPGTFPWYVEIKVTLMGSRNYEKWKAFKKISASKADEWKESYGVTIDKLIYLGNRGQL
jgi:hypothetical protein